MSVEKLENLKYLMYLAAREHDTQQVKKLFRYISKNDLFEIKDVLWSAQISAQNGYGDLLKFFLDNGLDPSINKFLLIKDSHYYRHYDVCEYLCKKVIDKNIKDIRHIKQYLPDSLIIKYDYLLAADDMDLL